MAIKPYKNRSRNAAALIVAIWVIGLLSLLVGSFAFQAHLEARITSYYRSRLEAASLAKAGVERAYVILVNSREISPGSEPSAEEKEKPFWEEAHRLAQGKTALNIVDALGSGKIRLDIRPEPALRNINEIDEEDWVRILELCHVPEFLWDGLIDAFMDWRDPREERRLDGADADYYLELDPPYRPRHGPLASMDELLLIKGFTPAIVYGGVHEDAHDDDPRMTGFQDIFTVFGDGRVNVNAASKRVLMTLPGMDELTAQDIIYARDGVFLEEWERADAAFGSPDDFFGQFPDLRRSLHGRIVTDTRIYRVFSIGEVDGVRRGVRATVQLVEDHLLILRWKEAESL